MKRIVASLMIVMLLLVGLLPVHAYALGTLYVTTNTRTPVWSEPRSSSIKKNTLGAGVYVSIVDTTTNEHGNRWGKTPTGTWIYMGNLASAGKTLSPVGVYSTVKEDVPLRHIPSAGAKIEKYVSIDTLLTITDTYYTDTGHEWGNTADGYVVYMGNVARYDATIRIAGLSLNRTSATLKVGIAFSLKNTVIPENAAKKAVLWTTDKAAIASVDAKGLVRALAAGTAVITCRSADNPAILAQCTITVRKTGNGLLAEYFQYRNAEYPFSSVDKRYEVSSDIPDKRWENNPYKKKTERGLVSYNRLKVLNVPHGAAQPTVLYVNTNNMAIRWSGSLCVPTAGSYKFRIRGNGGVSFYLVNSEQKVLQQLDRWNDGLLNSTTLLGMTSTVKLSANTHYPIILEYFNQRGAACLILEWSKDNGKTWSVVPKTVLFSSNGDRSVSLMSLNDDELANAKAAQTKLAAVLDKNYLKEQTVSAAMGVALNQLGARTKKLIGIADGVRKDGLERTLTKQLGKLAFGKLFMPVSKAGQFIAIFDNLFAFAKNASSNDSKRALGYLLLKENPAATIYCLPSGYQEACVLGMLDNDSFGLDDFATEPDNFFWNMGRLAGTINRNQREEFTFLVMAAIAETYVFEYTDYIQMLIE